jgi:hypothetical protein
MALLSATLSVRGEESGRLEVAQQAGQPVSAAIAAAKQQLMALVNAEVAKAEGAAAAAEGEKGAARAGGAARGVALRRSIRRRFGCGAPRRAEPDVYEENVVEGDEDAADAARLKLPQKRKKGQQGKGGGGAGKGGEAPAAPMAE